LNPFCVLCWFVVLRWGGGASGPPTTFALIPTLFMYITTMAATLVIARNLWETVVVPNTVRAGAGIAVGGAVAMILVSILLLIAAAMIGIDGWRAYRNFSGGQPETRPVPAHQPT
jgi:hypothetical protein